MLKINNLSITPSPVTPAKAGVHGVNIPLWIPALAGMMRWGQDR